MDLLKSANLTAAEIARELGTSLEHGLSSAEARSRLERYGHNELSAKSVSWREILLGQFRTPFMYLLAGAAVVSALVGELVDGAIIVVFVTVNVALGFWQEYRSEQALRILRRYLVLPAKVKRDSNEIAIDSHLLVPGDVIVLEAGDIVPADARIASASDFSLDESSLTGESVPVSKSDEPLSVAPKDRAEAANAVFAGSKVVSGRATAVVLATGRQTAIGVIASLTVETAEESAFVKGLQSFSNFILRIIISTLALVFIANLAIKGGRANPLELLVFSVALAVSVIPEALPVVSTMSLSRGAVRMAKRKVVVKRLSAIEDLGSIEVLCTDKTGTLTENKLVVSGVFGDVREVLYYASIASNERKRSAEPFDTALWERLPGESRTRIGRAKVLEEQPFDPKLRRSAALIEQGGSRFVVIRGAPEEVLSLCHVADDDALEWTKGRGQNGERVLAAAFRKVSSSAVLADIGTGGFELAGIVAFTDPVKPSTAAAVEKSKALGVKVKIITGDGREVAAAVAKSVGLAKSESDIMTGAEFASLNLREQHKAAERVSVFARVTPEEKFAIVRTLQERYEVGFLGDGVNDAPALSAAGVGIVVKGASGVAQEAADIILLQRNLDVVVDGIREGRQVFANTMKYLRSTLASNFGNFYTIAIGSLFLDFLPMLPIQILLVNLLSDFPMVSIAADSVDRSEIARPEKYQVSDVVSIATVLGVVSSIFDFIFLSLFFRAAPGVLQTNWFIESVLTELVLIFSVRTRYPFYRAAKPAAVLVILTIFAFAATAAIPYTSFGDSVFHFVPPSTSHAAAIFTIVVTYFVASEFAKRFYYRYRETHLRLAQAKRRG